MKHFKFKSVTTLANLKLSVKSSAIILAASSLLSAVLGLFRNRLLSSYYFGTYPVGIDAYTAAFTIPDFMFMILTSGALAVSFIPVFSQRLASGNKKSAWELSSSLINLFAIITLVASIFIMIFADPLIRYVVSPGLDESGMVLAINMTRVIAINPFLFSIAAVLTSIQQSVSRFIFYAFAPALYNVGIIIGITCFTDGINLFGLQLFEGGIMGVALGVILGAVMQLIVSLIGLYGLGVDYEFKIYAKNQGFRSVLKLLPARSLDQGIDYANSIVSTNLASRMSAGSIWAYNLATSLQQMPVSLIGVAISTAFFPQLSDSANADNEKDFCDTLRSALNMIIWLALPIAVIFFFARGYFASLVNNLSVSASGSIILSSALGALAVSVFASSVFHIASRGFYAKQDTKTPLYISIFAVGLNIALSILFYNLDLDVIGLGLAQSIAALLEIFILLAILNRRLKRQLLSKTFWRHLFRIIFASAITACVAYSMTKFVPLMATDVSLVITIPKLALICAVSALAYLIASYFLDLEEIHPLLSWLKKALFKNVK